MTGILAAMQIEMALLAERLENAERRTVSGVEFLSGAIAGKPVVLAVCGIGKVNAAVCAQTMALLYHPDVMINTGVGGALNRTLHVLDVVVGTYAVQHDVDTSALGDEKGFVSTVNRLRFPLSERVSDDLDRALVDTGARAVRGDCLRRPVCFRAGCEGRDCGALRRERVRNGRRRDCACVPSERNSLLHPARHQRRRGRRRGADLRGVRRKGGARFRESDDPIP